MVGERTGGFQGEVTVQAGPAAIPGWAVTWTSGAGQTIGNLWGGRVTQTGTAVTVRNAAWNGALAAGARTTFGFIASRTGPSAPPAVSCART